jgi:hypothetical protein
MVVCIVNLLILNIKEVLRLQHEQIEFFYAYDLGLINYLRRKGVRYITKAKHIKTDNIFAIFIKSDELNKHVERWNELHN